MHHPSMEEISADAHDAREHVSLEELLLAVTARERRQGYRVEVD